MNALFAYLVEIYLGPVLGWVDITADVQGDIKITRGKSSEGARADRGRCALRLDNLTGRYSPRNGSGSWYGLLGRNTPLRVSAGRVAGPLRGRFYGEVPAWPPAWNGRGTVRYVDVDAVGILERMGQGEQPKLSPMRRAFTASDPVAYWPMEDGVASSQVASALSGHPPLAVTGTAAFVDVKDYAWGTGEAASIRFGTAKVVDLKAGASLAAVLPGSVAAATATAWTVSVSALTDYHFMSADVVLLDVTTPGGTFVRWQLIQRNATTKLDLLAYDQAGTQTLVAQESGLFTTFTQLDVSAWQDGGTIRVTIDTYVASNGTIFNGAANSIAGTLAGVAAVGVNTGNATSTDTTPYGHLAVWATAAIPAQLVNDFSFNRTNSPLFSMWREPATVRLARLCEEAAVPLAMPAVDVDDLTPMGWQPAGTLLELLDQAADVDGGYLHEDRDALGLAYRPRSSLYNQTPTPIAYVGQLALAPAFVPVDDLDEVVNDVTVERVDGSQFRLTQDAGPLAAVPPPAGVGVYPSTPKLHLLADAQLPDQAGWRLHKGTVDRPRYPALGVQLAAPEWQAAPAALDALLLVDTGDVVEVTGLPSFAAGDVRTLVTGYTETISRWTWSIVFAGVPAQPWDVAAADGDARVPADGSTLAAAVTAGALTMQLATTADNGLWTTDPADYPQDLRVGEERVTVTAITGASSPQTATVSARSVNGVTAAWPAGAEVDVWEPAVAAL